MADLTYLEHDALLSEDSRYRYLLRRVWDDTKDRVLFVMLNPSTADATEDDATIRACRRHCTAWGYGGLEVVNLFAWRATDPKELTQPADPIGPRNDEIIESALARCDFAVCAWGADKMAPDRAQQVMLAIQRRKTWAYCLGTNKNGSPKHPLYIKTGKTPEIFKTPQAAESERSDASQMKESKDDR